MTEQPFDDVETMLGLGGRARLSLLQVLFDLAQFVVLERLAQSWTQGGALDIGPFVFRPFAHALVAGVAKHHLSAHKCRAVPPLRVQR